MSADSYTLMVRTWRLMPALTAANSEAKPGFTPAPNMVAPPAWAASSISAVASAPRLVR